MDNKARPAPKVPVLHAERGDCCGCTACYAICPVRAISMKPDIEGFLFPKIDEDACIRCGRCLSVCIFKRRLAEAGR